MRFFLAIWRFITSHWNEVEFDPTHKCLAPSCQTRVSAANRTGVCWEHYNLIGDDQPILETWELKPDIVDIRVREEYGTVWQVLDIYPVPANEGEGICGYVAS